MEFSELVARFTATVEQADFKGFGELFTEDAVYWDGFYGPLEGRAAIEEMLRDHFHGSGTGYKWKMEEPVYSEPIGYARYIFSYDSTIPDYEGIHVVFEGMSQFTIRDGRIACYREVFDRGVPLTQLGYAPERIGKSLKRWTHEMLATDRAKSM